MLKCVLLLLVAVLTDGVAADSDISIQDQIYIVSGVLGGVSLILTIVVIIHAVSIVRLNTQVAQMKSSAGPAKRTFVEPPRPHPAEMNRSPPMEEPYSRGLPPRDNYRMDRPVPPPRPQRPGPSSRPDYY